RDAAHGHRGDADFVADPVAVRGLVEPPVFGVGVDGGLAGGDVDDVASGCFEGGGEGDGVVAVEPVRRPVGGGYAYRDGFLGGPHLPHRREHFQGEAHAVLQRAAVFVITLVGERRQ